MKLVKLSLAAVVAAGSFSFANAVALDEAIQNVDLSGYLRYRYDSKTVKTSTDAGSSKNRNGAQTHKYKAHLKLTSDIADNFQAVAVLQYNSDNDRSYRDESYIHDNGFNVRDAYLSYTNFDTTFAIGKMEIGSIWTDDLLGTGIKVTNNSIEGVTLAAFAFDNYNADSDFFGYSEKIDTATVATTHINGKPNLGPVDVVLSSKYDIAANNLYGIAALLDFDPVSAELWVGYMNKVGTFYAVDFGFNGGDEDFGYNVHAQYAGNSLKGDVKDDLNAANGNFYGIEAGVNVAGFDANLGYVGFGKKDKFTLHSIEDKGQLIDAGEIVMGIDDEYHGGLGKRDFIFGTLGYTYDAVRFGVDIVSGKNKYEIKVGDKAISGKTKYFEITPRLSYKYSDKLNFSSFYAYGKSKYEGGSKSTEKKIRLEAKYSF